MSMSRRDYQDVASAINMVGSYYMDPEYLTSVKQHERLLAVWAVTFELADRFAMRSDRFDRERFVKAATRSWGCHPQELGRCDCGNEYVLGSDSDHDPDTGLCLDCSSGDEVDRCDPDLIASLNSAISEGAE